MRALPFLFCLFSVAFACHALATVNPEQEARAERICLTRPTVCGLRP